MIHISNLSLVWPGKNGPVTALRDIDLHIKVGEIFGIIGRSGAGKSSLVRCMNLLNRPSSGRILVDEQDLMTLSPAALRQARHKIGMVFQHFNLLSSRTVAQNVALPLELAGLENAEIRRRVGPLLEMVGLEKLADRYPSQISGGQKQRVGIARALASRPRVLLCDEATSALDPETTRAILDLLRGIHAELGLTIVLITHQMPVVQHLAQRVAVMEAGRIVEMGATLDVFTRAQHPMTRSLLEEVIPRTLGAQARAQVQQLLAAGPGRLVRVVGASGTGWLSALMRQDNLTVQIIQGQMDHIQQNSFCAMTLFLRGDEIAQQNAKNILEREELHVEYLSLD